MVNNGAHLPWGVPLVIMEASLHTDHRVARDMAKHQVTLVTLHCMEGERERGERERERGRERERSQKTR